MTEHRVNPLQWLSTKFASLNHSHNEYLTNHQDISGKEDISSKVTSLSENSTNTQYPSAKCVYDTVDVVDDKVSVVYNTVSIIDTSDSVYDADRWTENGTMSIGQTSKNKVIGGGNGYVIYDGNISNLDNYDITLNLTPNKTNTHVYINDNDIGTLPTSQTSILFKKRNGVVKVVYDNNQYDASAVQIIAFNIMSLIRYTIDIVLYQGMIYDVIDSIPSKTSDLTNDSGFLTQHQSLSNYVTNNDSRLTDARTPTAHNHNDLYYTETETDNLLNEKSNTNHTHSQYLTQHQSLANYIQKSSTNGLLKNDGSVDTTQYLSSLPSHNHDDRYYTETEIDTELLNKIDKNDFNVNYVYSFVYDSSIEKYAYQGHGAVGIGVSAIDENDNSLLNENGVAIIDLVFQNTNINYGSIQLVLAEADGRSYSYSDDLSNTQPIATISDTNEHHITVVVSSDTHIEEQSYDYYDLKVSKIRYDGSNITVSSGKTNMEEVGVYLVFNGAIGGNIEYMNVIKRTPIVNQIIDIIYPIGSTYISVNSANPSFLFGGEWEQIQDRFLLASGTNYANGTTGGEATHTLTVNEMPSHTHTQNAHSHNMGYRDKYDIGGNARGVLQNGASASEGNASTSSVTATNKNTGGGQAHNNMPPYLTVYMWKRIA